MHNGVYLLCSISGITGFFCFVIFQTEDARTLGSVDSTTYEKRQFAYQSLRYNLKNKIFQDLFPDLCQVGFLLGERSRFNTWHVIHYTIGLHNKLVIKETCKYSPKNPPTFDNNIIFESAGWCQRDAYPFFSFSHYFQSRYLPLKRLKVK